MPRNVDDFVKQVEESGIVPLADLLSFLPPNAAPCGAKELADAMVLRKRLTQYQATEFYQGRGDRLVLGNYTILDRIGSGGMGQVFKAHHRQMRRIVALKVLSANITADPVALARFQREAQAAAKLEHPNIVAAYDADDVGDVHFLVMQFIDGTDLATLVKTRGLLPVETAIGYTRQTATGLAYAHDQGVVHRDIKPSNLLLDKEGAIKILDMGLARIEPRDADSETQAQITTTGAVLGTVDFMSPEQAMNTKYADARSDVYSLGCTLWALLTGGPVYRGATVVEKLVAHREHPIPSLRDWRPDAPPAVDALFARMIAKRPDERMQSMSEVLAAIATISRESSREVEEIGRPSRGAKWWNGLKGLLTKQRRMED